VQNPHLHKNSILTVTIGDAFSIFVQSQTNISFVIGLGDQLPTFQQGRS
jgi:hypothetical protein